MVLTRRAFMGKMSGSPLEQLPAALIVDLQPGRGDGLATGKESSSTD